MTDPWDWRMPISPPMRADMLRPESVPTPGTPAALPPNAPPPNALPLSAPPPPTLPDPTRRSVVAAAWVASLAVVLGIGVLIGRSPSDSSSTESPGAIVSISDPSGGAGSSSESDSTVPAPVSGSPIEPVSAVAEALSPAVVQIATEFGLGSGVAYDEENGYIITNAHVVEGADSVDVVFADGSSTTGSVLGADVAVDVAVVQVKPEALLGVAVVATGVEVTPGQLAVAVGSPFGYEQTVTSGIVSAIDRPFLGGEENVVAMIQTDAAINSGNSGGALANREGQVIGINTAIISESGENNGIGFAIPIETAMNQADKIISGDSLDLPFLGVGGAQTPAEDDDLPGALITEVEQDSSAADAGLQPGDIILSIDGHPLSDFGQLAGLIGSFDPGTTVAIEVMRDGDTFAVDTTLGSR